MAAVDHAEKLKVGADESAILLDSLGMHLRFLGRLDEARGILERALRIDKAVFGPDHPKVAIRLNNLGRLLEDFGEIDAAVPHLSRALEICRKVLGEDHPTTKIIRANLAALDTQAKDG